MHKLTIYCKYITQVPYWFFENVINMDFTSHKTYNPKMVECRIHTKNMSSKMAFFLYFLSLGVVTNMPALGFYC